MDELAEDARADAAQNALTVRPPGDYLETAQSYHWV